jgi:hypothetical protein
MADEGDFPTTDDSMAASTKRLADWTFSLQGVGADLKGVVNDLKDYWRKLTPSMAMAVPESAAVAEPKGVSIGGINMRQGSIRNRINFTLPKEARELIVSTIAAVAVLTSLYLWEKVRDADKDIQTQIWLRSDSLTKENAELRGHIIAIEDLVQSYGMGKNIPKPQPLLEEKRK